MAISTTVTLTNRVSTTNPQGSLFGYKGQITEWDDGGILKKFECTNGTDWRLIEKDGIKLIQRSLPNFSDLTNITDLEVGEEFTINSVNSKYVKDSETIPHSIEMVDNDTDGTHTQLDSTDYSGDVIAAGSVLKMKIKVDELFIFGNDNFFLFRDNVSRISLKLISGKLIIATYNAGAKYTIVCKNQNDIIINSSDIQLKEWITIEATTTVQYTASSVASLGFTSTQNNYGVHIKYLDLYGDVYNFEETNGDIINNTNSTNSFTNIDTGKTIWNITEMLPPFFNYNNKVYKLIVPNNIISPQQMGYNAINTNREDSNYASDIINNIELSSYKLEINSGRFCLNKPINLYSQQSHYWSDGVSSRTSVPESIGKTVEFYTHKKIDYIRVFDSGINIYGGFYNTSLIPYSDDYADLASFPATGIDKVNYVALDSGLMYYWNGITYINDTIKNVTDINKNAILKICFRDNHIINNNFLYLIAKGNKASTQNEGGGINGVMLDTTIVNEKFSEKTGAGESFFLNIDFYGEYIDTCFLSTIDSNLNPGGYHTTGEHNIKILSWVSKQAIVLDGLSFKNTLDIDCQGGDILSLNERNNEKKNTTMYLESGSNSVLFTEVDINKAAVGDNYYSEFSLTNNFINNVLLGNWDIQANINEIIPFKNNPVKLHNPDDFILTDGYRLSSRFIYNNDNVFSDAVNRGVASVTFASYENIGGTFDFENNIKQADHIDYSGQVNSNGNVTVDFIDRFFKISDAFPLTMTYGGTFDNTDDDFIEIVINNFNLRSGLTEVVSKYIGFSAFTSGLNFTKIQIIATKSGVALHNSTIIYDSTKHLVLSKGSYLYTSKYDTIIIRIIGADATGNKVISGFFADSTVYESQNLPIINSIGGQKINGDLEIETLTIQETVQAASTATDIAGVVSDLNTLIAQLKTTFNQ